MSALTPFPMGLRDTHYTYDRTHAYTFVHTRTHVHAHMYPRARTRDTRATSGPYPGHEEWVEIGVPKIKEYVQTVKNDDSTPRHQTPLRPVTPSPTNTVNKWDRCVRTPTEKLNHF